MIFQMVGRGQRAFDREDGWQHRQTPREELRHTHFRYYSLKSKVTTADALESPSCSLERQDASSLSTYICGSYITMVRQNWDFSNGVDCNTRSRWCWLKHSLSVCILNASQSKSKPVCAALVCSLTITPPGSARTCNSEKKKLKLNTITGKTRLMWKHTSYCVMTITYTLYISNPCWLNNKLMPACVWRISLSLSNAEEPAWESEFVRLKKD